MRRTMTLPFALRSRIRLRDDGAPVSATRAQSVAVPIAAYWGVMGLLTYGVGSHWLHPERWISERPERRVAHSMSPDHPRRSPPVAVAPADPPVADRAPVAQVEPRVPVPEDPIPPHRFATSMELPELHRMPVLEPPQVPRTSTLERPRAPSTPSARSKEPRHFRLDPPYSPSADVDRNLERSLETPFPTAYAAPPLFEDPLGLPELPRDPAPTPRTEPEPPRARPAAVVASSCEAALEHAHDDVDLSAAPSAAPDLSRDAFAHVLERGTYLSSCGIPDDTALDLCVAVQHGRAVGITVSASPPNGRVAACVRRAVAGLSFPENAKLDVTRTRFDRLSKRPR